ncbi:hypothetical protein Hdeb2414_s0003g00106241 [Helianthus debilis subsp. tardiflorus]
MAPGKDNLSESVSVLTQRQLDKFVREYNIPLDLNPVLPSKDETVYPFRQGKFPLYTRACNFANYWVPFSRFLIREDMRWRFKDQTMSFDLGEDFVFDQELACALIEHKSPIRPLHEHFILLGRVCFRWSQGDRDWPVIRRKHDHHGEDEVPLMKQVASSAQEIRMVAPQNTTEQAAVEVTSSIPTPTKGAAGSSGSQAGKKSILDGVDNDPEIRSLDEDLLYRPSASLEDKGVSHEVKQQSLVRKRKTESLQIHSSDSLPMPKLKKGRKGSLQSGSDVMVELDEHLTGGKFSREEAALARSKPTPVFFGGFLPVNETESMDVENLEVTSKRDGKTPGEHKVVTFSGTSLGSSLGPDCFVGDVFSDDMEIDPATAEEKFVPDWDIQNRDSVMDELIARTLLFNISTPLDHARSRKMKSQDLGAMVLSNQAQSNVLVTELYRRWVEAESVRENLEKDISLLKRKIQKTPDSEKKIAQLTQDLQVQQEKVKALMTQNQSSQAAATSAAEDRDMIAAERKNFSESLQEKDREHKAVMAKMEESFNNARQAYANMMAGEADLKAQIEEMKCNHEVEVGEIKKENAALKASVDDLQMTKAWLLSEGAAAPC